MARFAYEAFDRQGSRERGFLEVENSTAALQHLRTRGLVPVSVASVDASQAPRFNWRTLASPKRAVSRKSVVAFIQRLGALLQAGITVERALEVETHALEADNAALARRLREAVRGGASLSEAMRSEGKAFPGIALAMVRTGEAGGFLPLALQRLGEFLAHDLLIREKIRTALAYPRFLLAAAIIFVVLILGIVLPRFRMLFEDSGLTPPLHLEVMFGASSIVEQHWPELTAVLMALVAGATFWARARGGRERLARLARRLPLVGPIIVFSDIGRFSRCLGTLVGAAVPLPDAAKLAATVPNNPAIAEDLAPLSQGLREGQSLSALLRGTSAVPSMLAELVGVGETTGDLADTLTRAAVLLEQEAEHRSERLLALLVPAITVALGLGVAAMIGSVVGVLIELNALAG